MHFPPIGITYKYWSFETFILRVAPLSVYLSLLIEGDMRVPAAFEVSESQALVTIKSHHLPLVG